MIRLPPRSTLTDTPLPNTTLFRSLLSATGRLLLDRRTRHRAVRAEHATIAVLGPQYRAAAWTLVEKLTGRRRHHLGGLMPALGASHHALQLQISHRSRMPWPGSLLRCWPVRWPKRSFARNRRSPAPWRLGGRLRTQVRPARVRAPFHAVR